MHNVTLWHSDIRVSWKTQCISLLMHGALILLILLPPWDNEQWPVWLAMVTLVIFDCLRSQRNIQRVQGNMLLLNGGIFQWQDEQWKIEARPVILRWGVLLKLISLRGKRRKKRLWLAIDSMDTESWRNLRYHLLQLYK